MVYPSLLAQHSGGYHILFYPSYTLHYSVHSCWARIVKNHSNAGTKENPDKSFPRLLCFLAGTVVSWERVRNLLSALEVNQISQFPHRFCECTPHFYLLVFLGPTCNSCDIIQTLSWTNFDVLLLPQTSSFLLMAWEMTYSFRKFQQKNYLNLWLDVSLERYSTKCEKTELLCKPVPRAKSYPTKDYDESL